MTPDDHTIYEDWDAAYVLGALSPAERREFEDHLSECERCRAAVAELAPMPGLLARVATADAETLLIEDTPSPASASADLVRLVRLDTARRRRTRRMRIVVGIAAAAVVAGAIAVPLSLQAGGSAHQSLTMQAVGNAPVSASLQLSSVAWGTRLDLKCSYAESPAESGQTWSYGLFVTGRDGSTSELSTWKIGAGATARLQAGTALPISDISRIEVRALGSGAVILQSQLG